MPISYSSSNISGKKAAKAKPLKHAAKELSDEIKAFREKKKQFDATNERDTYIVVCFSTKADKEEFCKNAGIKDHTFTDGYKLAKKMNIEPDKPKFKLRDPLT